MWVSGDLAEAGADRPGRHRAELSARPTLAGAATMTAARPCDLEAQLFTRAVLEHAAHRPGQPLALLQAGCATAGEDPDVGKLRAAGCNVAVSLIDDDNQTARATVIAHRDLVLCRLCDLRLAPLIPRSFDIGHCALPLERISHAELVLDRLLESLKPGGLLLLQTGDRDCAAGFLDRVLPRPLRAAVWRSQRPGKPGPYPPRYTSAWHQSAESGPTSCAAARWSRSAGS